jgi:hypothetical protein
MSCRRAWNDEFLDLNFTRAFRTGAWKKHREDVLMDREMALLPTRQPRVEALFKVRECDKERSILGRELRELEVERVVILRKYQTVDRRRTRYWEESHGRIPPAWTLEEDERGVKKEEKEKTKFIMKCPDAECRGFLSTAYKCGTCQLWACPDCLEIKGKEKDTEHTCNEERKQSVALILKESRPCPKCGERISKIEGCDQMWCTTCHTAFSWNTGQAVNGVVHNPHYYEFLRKQGNGVAPRNAGDVPCGGVPYYHTLQTALRKVTTAQLNILMAIHRLTSEIADQRIQGFQSQFNQNDNGDLGTMYLMKEIDKEYMKKELAKRELKRNKHLAIRAVLEMFVTTSTMMLNHIVNEPPKNSAEFEKTLDEFRNLKKYVNESLMLVSKQKNCSVPQIGTLSYNKPKKDTDTLLEQNTWSWLPFNKVTPVKKVKKETKKEEKKEEEEEVEESSDDETDSLVEDVKANTAE